MKKKYKKILIGSLFFISFLSLGIPSVFNQKNKNIELNLSNNFIKKDALINSNSLKQAITKEIDDNKRFYGGGDGDTLIYIIYKKFFELINDGDETINSKNSIGDLKKVINDLEQEFKKDYASSKYYFLKPSIEKIVIDSLKKFKSENIIDTNDKAFTNQPLKNVLNGSHEIGAKDYFEILNHTIRKKARIYEILNEEIKKNLYEEYEKFLYDDSTKIIIPEKEKFKNNHQLIDKLLNQINILNFETLGTLEARFFDVDIKNDLSVSLIKDENDYRISIKDYIDGEKTKDFYDILVNQKFKLFALDWKTKKFLETNENEVVGVYKETSIDGIPKNNGYIYNGPLYIGRNKLVNFNLDKKLKLDDADKTIRKGNIKKYLLNNDFNDFEIKWRRKEGRVENEINIVIDSTEIPNRVNHKHLTDSLKINFKFYIKKEREKPNYELEESKTNELNNIFFQLSREFNYEKSLKGASDAIEKIFNDYRNKKESIIYDEESFTENFNKNQSENGLFISNLFKKTIQSQKIIDFDYSGKFGIIKGLGYSANATEEIIDEKTVRQIARYATYFGFSPYFSREPYKFTNFLAFTWYEGIKITKIEKQKYIDEAEQYRDFKLIEFQNDSDIKENKDKKYETFKVETFDIFNNFKNNIIPNTNEKKKDLDQALINYKIIIDQKYEEIKKKTTFIKENIHKELIKKYGANNIPPEVSKLALNNPKFLEELLKDKKNFNKTLDLIAKNKWLVDKIKDLSTSKALDIIKQLTNIENNRKYGFLAIGVSLSLIAFASLSGLAIIKFTKKRAKNNYYGVTITFSLIALSSVAASIPAFLKFFE